MSGELTVRDRPWSFWGGATLLFFGIVMLGITFVLGGGNVRMRETTEVVRWIAIAFVAVGAIGCWRGRAARYDASSKQLVRGAEIVRDLSNARGLFVYPLGGNSPAHYVLLVLGDADVAPDATLEQVRQSGNFLLPVAEGVPPGMAKRAAIEWRDALGVPATVLPGCSIEL